jgi:hypothetical protein
VKKPPTAASVLVGDFDRKGFSGAGDTYLRKADKKDLSKNIKNLTSILLKRECCGC